MTPMIRVSHLDKYFGRLHVLKDLSFEINAGEVICIIGPSGSGKSTLLRCINFLEKPDHGEIEVDGVLVEARGKGTAYHRKIHDLRLRTGMVFQHFNLFPHMTALDNVIEGVRIRRTRVAIGRVAAVMDRDCHRTERDVLVHGGTELIAQEELSGRFKF